MSLRLIKLALIFILFIDASLYIYSDSYTFFDDAYITFRYAKNVYDGYGFRWNVNDNPTEGCSSPLYTLLLLPGFFFNLNPNLYAKMLNGALSLLVLLIFFKMASKNQEKDNLLYLLPFVFLFTPLTINNILLGMESTLVMFLVTFIFYRIETLKSMLNLYLIFFIGFLGFLARMDFMVIFLGLIPFAIYKSKKTNISIKQFFIPTLSLFMLLIIYNYWRYNYFGDLFPNPYYLKFVDKKELLGLSYVMNYAKGVGVYLLLLLMVIAIKSLRFNNASNQKGKILNISVSNEIVFYLIPVFLFLIYVATINPISGGRFRFLYPTFPLILMAIGKIEYKSSNDNRSQIAEIFLLLSLFSMNLFYSYYYKDRTYLDILTCSSPISKYNPENPKKEYGHHIIRIAKILSEYNGIKEKVLVSWDVGIVSYYTQAKVIDPVGLNDSFIARNAQTSDKNMLVDYILNKKPDLFLIPVCFKKPVLFSHGPLNSGNFCSKNKRFFDNYHYSGTFLLRSYNYEIFIRDDNNEDLERYLNNKYDKKISYCL